MATPFAPFTNVADAGIYRFSLRTLVTSGISWAIVSLLVGIPLVFVSFVFYLGGSLRGTTVFIGSLAGFLYQYLLWTFDWGEQTFDLSDLPLAPDETCLLYTSPSPRDRG